MSYVFSIKKTIQATAIILKAAPDCQLNYMKFLKLLYIADRESIKETGVPITGDSPVAMRHGPVLSKVYDLIMKRDVAESDLWEEIIEKNGLTITLLDDPGDEELCQYEIDKLKEVFTRYEDKNQWDMRDITHAFEEWKKNDPGHSSQPIPLEHIIDAVGRSDDMDDILQDREESTYFSKLFEG